MTSANPRLVTAGLLLIAALSIGPGLGQSTFWEPDEPRFAEATRQMFARADFITPYLNGVPRFEKPILFYWLQALAYTTIGPSELAARLPSALAGIGTVLLLYLLASRITSHRAAILAALALATMFRFVVYARQGLTDVPVLFFNMAALYGFVRATEAPPSRAALWLAWTAVGLGILTKGPIGVLSVAIWGVYAAVRRQWSLVAQVRPLGGLALAMLIAAPWYLLMVAMHGRAWIDFALGHEIVARAVSEGFTPYRSFFYYVKVWLGDAAPWSVLFVAALAWLALRWRTLDDSVRSPVVFAMTWFSTVFILFSVPRSKLAHYIIPTYPAAALVIGVFIDQIARRPMEAKWWRVPMIVVAAIALVAAAALAWSLDILMPDASWPERRLVSIVLAGGGVMIALAAWRSAVTAAVSLSLTLAATFAVIGVVIVPHAIEGFKPMPRLARAAERLAEPGARIGLVGAYGASSLIYYSHHNIDWLDEEAAIVFLTTQPHALCVMPAARFERVAPHLPPHIRVVDTAEEFNVRIERLVERQRTPGRMWVLVAAGDANGASASGR
jgi:4-amino-4-deoxy-L-arabinose transferase-like glycosyltransferase